MLKHLYAERYYSILIYVVFLEISLFVSYYGLSAYTGITGLGFCGNNWCAHNVYQYPPLNFYAIDVGAGLGLFVITIVLYVWVANTVMFQYITIFLCNVRGIPKDWWLKGSVYGGVRI